MRQLAIQGHEIKEHAAMFFEKIGQGLKVFGFSSGE